MQGGNTIHVVVPVMIKIKWHYSPSHSTNVMVKLNCHRSPIGGSERQVPRPQWAMNADSPGHGAAWQVETETY